MRRLRRVLAGFVIGAVLAGQAGCTFLIGKAAMAGGKHVYKKIKEDLDEKKRAKNDRAKHEEPTASSAEEEGGNE